MRNTDLTAGPIASSIISFSLPLILGNALQTLYNAADSVIVGRFIGPDALASVGSAYSLMTFLTSIMIGLSMGAGISFSYLYAAGDGNGLRKALSFSFAFIASVTVAITAVSIAAADAIITLLSVPESLYAMMKEYLRFIFPGLPALFVYNFFASAERAIGNSKVPLLFMGASALMNIALDILLVAVFPLGIGGAAIATLISQCFAAIGIMLYALIKTPMLRFSPKELPSSQKAREIISLSVLTALQQSVMNFGILMVQGIVNTFGESVMAAFAAGVKIDSLAYMPLQEFGNAFSTFVSQNKSAGNDERVRKGVGIAFSIAAAFSLAVTAAIVLIPDVFMRAFVDESESGIIAIGSRYLRIEGSFYILIGFLFLFYAIFRGLKCPSISLLLTVISLGLRVILAYVISKPFGPDGIWISIPIGWAIADSCGFMLYIRKSKQ